MKLEKAQKHYLALIGILLLGTWLRFWHLDLKPLWLDEVVTALFSLGRNYQDIPVEKVLSLAEISQLFTLKQGVSCPEIAHNLTLQSTHPPLFFCLLHQWLIWLDPLSNSLAWKLRSFSALIGIGAIAIIYLLNRVAFSLNAGLMAAAIMAVSPFGVYLSQEARHYTLPVVLITSALLGLVLIYQSLNQGRVIIRFWLGWSLINAISFYVHYFCIIPFIAQVITLIIIVIKSKVKPYIILIISIGLPLILFIPWFPIFANHFSSPDTSWLPTPNHIEPLYQILITWLLMIIFLPIENQPFPIQILSGGLMISIGIWLGWQLIPKCKQLYRNYQTSLVIYLFILLVILQFLGIIYLLNKDITVAPRYHFVYYSGICSLLGASLALNKFRPHYLPTIIIIISIISSIFVNTNLAYQKPYQPDLVAHKIANDSPSTLMVISYDNSRNIALGLSYALAINKINSPPEHNYIYLLKINQGYADLWQKIPSISTPNINTLWILTSSLKQEGYLTSIYLDNGQVCELDPQQYDSLGISYQGYNCQ